MSRIIGKYTKGLKTTVGRLNTQQKGMLVLSVLIVGAIGGFLIIDSGGTYSLDINPTPGLPFASWPTGYYLSVEYPYYWFDGINQKRYVIPIVVTWEADAGIAYIKVEAEKVEFLSGYSTLEAKSVASEWSGRTRITEAYNWKVTAGSATGTINIRVRLTITDLRNQKYTSPRLITSATNYLDYTTKDVDAKDPAARINYDIYTAYAGDPGEGEVPPPDPDQAAPPPDYTPPAPTTTIGIADLFLISSLAVVTTVYYKKKRKIEV